MTLTIDEIKKIKQFIIDTNEDSSYKLKNCILLAELAK